MINVFLNLLAFAVIFSSVLVITSKNPVVAILFLISVFINGAGYLILMGIGFIGIAYIMIYIGAITVLFLFVVMMINIKLVDILEVGTEYSKNLPLALAIGSLFLFEMFTIIPLNNISLFSLPFYMVNNFNNLFLDSSLNEDLMHIDNLIYTVDTINLDQIFTHFLQLSSLGQGLYSYGAILLILSSIILLLAMVAPIILSKKSFD